MSTPATAPAERPTTAPPPKLVHCICSGCNSDVCFPLLRPTTALCGHVVGVGSWNWTGVEATCVVCDDLQPTHICPPKGP